MDYFAHAVAFLEAEVPCFVTGTAVPDWLVRARHAQPAVGDPHPGIAALAREVLQHFLDEARFCEAVAHCLGT